MTPEEYMNLAIEEAHKGKTPFGAVLVTESGKIHRAHNTTSKDGALAHAEIYVLRACLDDRPSVLYTTGEPCPMCTGAALWHKIDTIYYGVDIETISRFMPQIRVSSPEIIRQSFRPCQVHGQLLEAQCEELFRRYA